MRIAQSIHHLPLYKSLIMHLTNGTMRQAIHILDPSWIDPARIEHRTFKIAVLMGLIDEDGNQIKPAVKQEIL
jgi:hypothetical protein